MNNDIKRFLYGLVCKKMFYYKTKHFFNEGRSLSTALDDLFPEFRIVMVRTESDPYLDQSKIEQCWGLFWAWCETTETL